MALFFRNKLNVVLLVAGCCMAGVLITYLVAVARFLVSTGTAAFGGSLIKSGEIVTFNLAKAAQLQELRRVK